MTHHPTMQELVAGMRIDSELLSRLSEVTKVEQRIGASLEAVPAIEVRSASKAQNVSGPGAKPDEHSPPQPTRHR